MGYSHPRNSEFIIRACKLFQIDYHYTNTVTFPDRNYDIIWSPQNWIPPDNYPRSKFIFGPQFWVFPDPTHAFFTQSKPEHRHRCLYTSLSNWIVPLYQEFVDISNSNIPFIPLPFGLDDIQPKESTSHYDYDCIVYFKHRDPALLDFCKSVVESKGLRYRMFAYGSYQRQDYVDTLKRTRFAIWIGSHESQGFGFQECLATNTPIYVYDVKTMKEEYINGKFNYTEHKESLLATSASHWSDQCGKKVYSNEEFIDRFDEFIANISTYTPATFIQEYLTDRICFQRMLDTLQITY